VSELTVKSKSKSRTNKTQYECWQHVLCKELKYKIKELLCSNRQPYPNISILPFIFSVPIWHEMMMFCWIYCFATTGGSTSLLNFNITSGTSFFCCIFISSSLLFFAVEWYVHVQVHVFSLLYMLVSMNYM